MRVLFCGDVVGRAGRAAITEHIPTLRKQLALDFVLVNGENAASGFGITTKITRSFMQHGVDAITCGDHCFDQKELFDAIVDEPALLRPENFSEHLPGTGHRIYITETGKRIAVIHIMTRLFMRFMVDCPFKTLDQLLDEYTFGGNVDAILVDIHGEATSEKMALGHYLDGKVSMVSGSHTHVPTADYQILPGGTAYQTDAGMCGDYDSVIGFEKTHCVRNFLEHVVRERRSAASGEATLCGLFVDIDDSTGLANRVEPVRIGGRLSTNVPKV